MCVQTEKKEDTEHTRWEDEGDKWSSGSGVDRFKGTDGWTGPEQRKEVENGYKFTLI